jgi:hypothetical protein
VKADAAAKSSATRKARHTMGKRQKKDITGATVAPTAPAAPAANVIHGTVVVVPKNDTSSTNGGPNGAPPAVNGASPH